MKCILVIEEHTEKKDPKEIVRALKLCAGTECEGCPYHDRWDCDLEMLQDAANLIENLIAANKDQSEKLKKIREWLEEKERK